MELRIVLIKSFFAKVRNLCTIFSDVAATKLSSQNFILIRSKWFANSINSWRNSTFTINLITVIAIFVLHSNPSLLWIGNVRCYNPPLPPTRTQNQGISPRTGKCDWWGPVRLCLALELDPNPRSKNYGPESLFAQTVTVNVEKGKLLLIWRPLLLITSVSFARI
jgi:hypothetical protein